MNIATIVGFLIGIILISASITFNKSVDLMNFVDVPGLLIVVGGIIAAIFVCYPLKSVFRVWKVFLRALRREELPVEVYISELQYLAGQAARKGTLQLESEIKDQDNLFLHDGLQMLVDNYHPEELREIMEIRIANSYQQGIADANIFKTMAKLAPAFGMVGTLIGLIGTFNSMQSAGMESLGTNISTALLTTFYGVLLSNLFFMPISVKVETSVEARAELMTVIMEGVLLIQKKTPPALVLDRLKSHIPERKWSTIKPRQK